MAKRATKQTRPKATINRPRDLTSTGGQWLNAWQQRNPGMFQPGISLEQVKAVVPEYTGPGNGDPAWIAAMYAQRTQGGGGGAVAAPAAKAAAPDYQPSGWLGTMQSLGSQQLQSIDARAKHDQGTLDYRLGLGQGADPANRFAAMNLLDRAFGRRITGVDTEMASMGLGFSGAKQRALGDADFDRAHGTYDVKNQHQDGTAQITRSAEDARLGVSRSLADSEQQDRDRYLESIRQIGAA